jgi:hypothetical protein
MWICVAEIEYPSCDETTKDRNIGHNDSNVIFDMVYAVVDRVSPVRVIDGVKAVAVGEIDLSAANSCHAEIM